MYIHIQVINQKMNFTFSWLITWFNKFCNISKPFSLERRKKQTHWMWIVTLETWILNYLVMFSDFLNFRQTGQIQLGTGGDLISTFLAQCEWNERIQFEHCKVPFLAWQFQQNWSRTWKLKWILKMFGIWFFRKKIESGLGNDSEKIEQSKVVKRSNQPMICFFKDSVDNCLSYVDLSHFFGQFFDCTIFK